MPARIAHGRLLELLSYNELDGLFRWKQDRYGGEHGSVLKVRAGDIAGNQRADGYVEIQVDGSRHYAHRLAWFYVTGQWPKGEVDHWDTSPSNNRWANLRDVSATVNQENKRGAYSNSKTGVKGVSVCKKTGRFIVFVKRKNVGRFPTVEEAIAARDLAEREMFAGPTFHGSSSSESRPHSGPRTQA